MTTAEPRTSAIDTIERLDETRNYSNIILTLPDTDITDDPRRYIALHPNTRQVYVTPKEIHYDQEAESFARHRRHYIAFWTLFLSMLGLDILWAE